MSDNASPTLPPPSPAGTAPKPNNRQQQQQQQLYHHDNIYTYKGDGDGAMKVEVGGGVTEDSGGGPARDWPEREPLPPPNHGEQQESRLLNYLMQVRPKMYNTLFKKHVHIIYVLQYLTTITDDE